MKNTVYYSVPKATINSILFTESQRCEESRKFNFSILLKPFSASGHAFLSDLRSLGHVMSAPKLSRRLLGICKNLVFYGFSCWRY